MKLWKQHGLYAGIFLVIAPILWDVLLMGARNMQLWEIHSWGIISQILGCMIVWLWWTK